MFLADVEQIVGHRFRLRQRSVELTVIARCQLNGPPARIGDVVRGPVDMGFEGAWFHDQTPLSSPARIARLRAIRGKGTQVTGFGRQQKDLDEPGFDLSAQSPGSPSLTLALSRQCSPGMTVERGREIIAPPPAALSPAC